MRIKLRSPAGTKVITLAPDATVNSLTLAIRDASDIHNFSAKVGFPPRPLDLAALEGDIPLSQTGVKLDGEQLIISSEDIGNSSEAVADTRSAVVERGPSSHPEITELIPSSQVKTSPSTPPARASSPDYAAIAAAAFPSTGSSNANDPLSVPMPERGGRLVLRVMPDDNSCLFRAVGTCMLPDFDTMAILRHAVADEIRSDPITFSDAFLGHSREDYIRTILDDQSWGGAIELSILSKYFDVEICSIDVKTLRVDQFDRNKDNASLSEDANASALAAAGGRKRCFVVYSGVHYDCIAFVPESIRADGDASEDQRVFAQDEDDILVKALELCRVLRDRGYYTDVAGFSIRCNTCGGKFKGQKGAVAHLKATGHSDFAEVS